MTLIAGVQVKLSTVCTINLLVFSCLESSTSTSLKDLKPIYLPGRTIWSNRVNDIFLYLRRLDR